MTLLPFSASPPKQTSAVPYSEALSNPQPEPQPNTQSNTPKKP
ncbi:unnamed protein product [Penicillium salamii]|uniref:Uncharacterized protein n=1 Tax=Penicillium salamii TaxID=1612424 RepID=A0A9W4NU45_9EURO|nr:unnamed protein product [Penicillium salamii]